MPNGKENDDLLINWKRDLVRMEGNNKEMNQVIECEYCGKENEGSSSYCTECGTEINNQTSGVSENESSESTNIVHMGLVLITMSQILPFFLFSNDKSSLMTAFYVLSPLNMVGCIWLTKKGAQLNNWQEMYLTRRILQTYLKLTAVITFGVVCMIIADLYFSL